MPNVIYSMSVSLDGFIAGPDGDFSWSAPDDELHRFHNDRVREIGVQLCGRRLYETMVYWERPDASWGATEREFAEIWQALPKIVFSSTLDAVEGNARLATAPLADELAALRAQPGKDIAVGGAALGRAAIEQGLVDEVQLFVNPVLVGGGTPFFPAVRRDLELLETRTFGGRVSYLRYAFRVAP
jgi:dihydrofolate reductase